MSSIVKTIKLLDDFHFKVFRDYVKSISIRSYYPLALIDVIDRSIEAEQDSDILCQHVYDEVNEKTKNKYYQLAFYTFGLTSFLAKNYPEYLQHNITRIQKLINEGALESANKVAEALLEISEKVEDFSTQIKVLNILAQQSALMESSKQALVYLKKAERTLFAQQALNELFVKLHEGYDLKGEDSVLRAKALMSYYENNFKHEKTTIRLISQYSYCFYLNHSKSDQFYSEETILLLDKLEQEFEKNKFIVFPYLVDFIHKIRYFKLRYWMRNLEMKGLLEKSSDLFRQDNDILYWNSYINQPEMFSIAIQANYYSNNYLTGYRKEHSKTLPYDVEKKLFRLKENCKSMLNIHSIEERFTMRYINLTTLYGLVLLVSAKKSDLEEAISRLNQILTSYQQFAFHAYVDAIYSILGTAHFFLKDYQKVNENFKRYRKATYGKSGNPINNFTIHGFYYIAKWLDTGREQYVKKLEKVLIENDAPQFNNIKKVIEDICEYHKIPISILKI